MSNRGEGALGAILSVVALVAIGAFMFWLNAESKQVEAERAAALAAQEAAMRDVTAADILESPAGVVGRHAVLDSVPVGLGLGQGVFTLSLGDSLFYPVLMSPDAIQRLRMADVTALYGGDLVYVEGQIYTLNDSIRGAWVTEGAVNETQAADIPTTPTFLRADSVVVY